MANKVFLSGNLGKDVEVSTTANGQMAVLSVGTSERWTDKTSGEKKTRTDWHKVVTFQDGLITALAPYLTKGQGVVIIGKLQTRKFQDAQTGQDRYATEVLIDFDGTIEFHSGGRSDNSGQGAGQPQGAQAQPQGGFNPNAAPNQGNQQQPQGGFNPNQGGFNPNQGGFNPNVAPNQGNQPQPQGGFNPNQGGFNPNQGGFNPNQGGFGGNPQ